MASKRSVAILERFICNEIESYLKKSNKKFRKTSLNELESATAAGDETAVAKLQSQKAELDKQIAALGEKKAALISQIDALEKK